MMRELLAAIAIGLTAPASALQLPETAGLEVAWEIVGEFESPESAAIAVDHNAIFVSNVSGYEKNGQGFISKLALDGTIQEFRWLTGLNAPTGLAVEGDTLWAVDYDRLVKISIPQQSVTATYQAPDADQVPLLNDVAVGPNGDVFVTGSNSNSVYKLQENGLVRWTRDDDHLKYANGIWVGDDSVIVAAYHLMSLDRETKSVLPMGYEDTLFDLEGVKSDNNGGFLVSLIGKRPLYRLTADGVLQPLFLSDHYLADFDVAAGLLVGPTGPNKISALKLN